MCYAHKGILHQNTLKYRCISIRENNKLNNTLCDVIVDRYITLFQEVAGCARHMTTLWTILGSRRSVVLFPFLLLIHISFLNRFLHYVVLILFTFSFIFCFLSYLSLPPSSLNVLSLHSYSSSSSSSSSFIFLNFLVPFILLIILLFSCFLSLSNFFIVFSVLTHSSVHIQVYL